MAGLEFKPLSVYSTVPSVSTAHTACPTLEQVLRRVMRVCGNGTTQGADGRMKLEIPQANLPLYPVLEDTLESQAAGMSGPHSQRDLGKRAECDTGPSPLQSAQPVSFVGLLTSPLFPLPMGITSMVALRPESWISNSGDLGSRPRH